MNDWIIMTEKDLANWDEMIEANPNLNNLVPCQIFSTVGWNTFRIGWVELDKGDR